MTARLVPSARAAVLAVAIACGAAGPVRGESAALPASVTLGMTVAQLQQALPGLQRVTRPVRLAGGLVGSWAGEPVDIAGVAVVPTFFMAGGQLRRIDYLAQDTGPAAFAALLDWARQAWGAELAGSGPEGAYASWSVEGVDAYLQLPAGGSAARTRLVVKQQVRKDADDL
ncbi:MAG: hypothetical protein EOO24_07345 [Comamonadaceae bacterium]|nr:MAG: hypothetical protein EOO24_07345 [Comamonadaceae bacterium]